MTEKQKAEEQRPIRVRAVNNTFGTNTFCLSANVLPARVLIGFLLLSRGEFSLRRDTWVTFFSQVYVRSSKVVRLIIIIIYTFHNPIFLSSANKNFVKFIIKEIIFVTPGFQKSFTYVKFNFLV